MTDYKYFKSEWIPRLPTQEGWALGGVLATFTDIAIEMGCLVSFSHYQYSYKRDNNVEVFLVMWRANSKRELLKCMTAIAKATLNQIEFHNLKEIEEYEFKKYFGDADYPPLPLGVYVGGLDVNVIRYLVDIAKENEKHLQGIS